MIFVCEKCDNSHNGKFGSGRFCSRSCANSRIRTDETKKKISNSIKKYRDENPEKATEDSKAFILGAKAANEKWVQSQLVELMNIDFSILKFERKRKRVILEQSGNCNHCGISEWNGKLLTLELEHKDGNHHNDERDNLEAICPNCHSQTDTWRGKNKTSTNSMRNKVTDNMIVEAFIVTGNIRQTLLKVGLAAKGANYGRVKKALTLRNIEYK